MAGKDPEVIRCTPNLGNLPTEKRSLIFLYSYFSKLWLNCFDKYSITRYATMSFSHVPWNSIKLSLLFLLHLAGVRKLLTSSAAFQPNASLRLWHRCLQPTLRFHTHQRLPKGLSPTSHNNEGRRGKSCASVFGCVLLSWCGERRLHPRCFLPPTFHSSPYSAV